MGSNNKGFSLNALSKYWDVLSPAEKSRFRSWQVSQMDLSPGEKVLDVGCGTGALTILVKLATGRGGEAAGIDIAPGMIAQARAKAARAGLEIDFRIASVDELPYPDGHFDLVTSSMMLHHLPVEIKEAGLKEICRVLKPEGRFFLCDFLAPHVLTAPLMFLLLIWISPTRYQFLGKLPQLIRSCGFGRIELRRKGAFLSTYMIGKQ